MAICVPHNCHCGSLADAHGLHSFVCRKAAGKIKRHHASNDLVARAFTSAGIPSSKEPHGLVRSDGKRPDADGLTLVPWKGGKPLAWVVTAVCTVADSYVAATAREAGAATERAAELKIAKYSGLENVYYYYCLLFAVTHAPFHVSSAEAYSWPSARDRRDREVN